MLLQGGARPWHLARAGLAAQLPDQFGALRQVAGGQGVAVAQQATGRVDDHVAAVGIVAILDEAFRLPFPAEAECLIQQDRACGAFVQQLADVDVLRADAGELVDLLRGGDVEGVAIADDRRFGQP
ncbi:hypothetical protein D3C78_1662130 [compost metagenome]